MAHKQQALMSSINKYVRQYFLYKEEHVGSDPVKVRLRNDIHRVEQAAQDDIDQKILQRLRDNSIGLMHPQYKPYEPVGGWPELNLDRLVLDAMAFHLDPKVWEAIQSQFDKSEIKRVYARKGTADMLKDFTAVHQCPYAGYQKIKTHLAESEARMQNVKAGFDFQQHFLRTHEERLRREAPQEETVKQFDADPDVVLAKERVRRDTIQFLMTLKDTLEKMLMLKVRHLRSATPINLALLGTDKDREGAKTPTRVQQYPGGPLVQHNFRDQIMAEAPPNWPGRSMEKPLHPDGRRYLSRVSSNTRSLTTGSISFKDKPRMFHGTGQSVTGGLASRGGSDSGSGSEKEEHQNDMQRRLFQDREIMEKFRKRWPPVWMTLACMDQGSYIADPSCPTREYHSCLGPPGPRRHKSFTDIMDMRKEWAQMRKNVSKAVDEMLWREDKEKLEAFRVQYATLWHLPMSKPYPNHQRHMDELLEAARSMRQKQVIYDCELTDWYKYLVEQIQETVGKNDEEINKLLESIKMYFKMSATSPKFGRAKLALITMSLPAYVVCQIHVQRVLRFILKHVLETPDALLTGWLACRGLPLVLVKTDSV